MYFDDRFFEDEVREGFYVPSLLKRCWAASIECLLDVDALFKKHNLRWWLGSGSALGAVREKGFIPWDDDVDIIMLRKDYEKALSILKELPPNYKVDNTIFKADQDYCLTRINNSAFIPLPEDQLIKYHQFPFVTGIDIFPIDSISDDAEEEENRCAWALVIGYLFLAVQNKGEKSKEIKKQIREFEKTFDRKFSKNAPILQQLRIMIDDVAGTFSYGPRTKYLCNAWQWMFNRGQKFLTTCFDETLMLPFENVKFPVPKGYDEYLACIYAENYLVRYKSAGCHEFPYFERMYDVYKKYNPNFIYTFKKDDLTHEKPNRPKQITDNILQHFNIFYRYQEIIKNIIVEGQFDLLSEVLPKCQNSAIALGNYIENTCFEPAPVISALENYCNTLYEIFSTADSQESVYTRFTELQTLVKEIETALPALEIRKLIIFLPFKASAWGTMKTYYDKLKSDPHNDVHVCPIPSYSYNLDGTPKNEYYEGDQFPKELNIDDYHTMILSTMIPDQIVIQSPYDDYSFGLTVHSEFYASKVKNYTDELIYIPWFRTCDIDPTDGKSILDKAVMRYYVEVPGVISADKTFVPSENIRQCYIDRLIKFTGEENAELWKERIQVLEDNNEI